MSERRRREMRIVQHPTSHGPASDALTRKGAAIALLVCLAALALLIALSRVF